MPYSKNLDQSRRSRYSELNTANVSELNLLFTSPVTYAGLIHLFSLTTAGQLPDDTAAQQIHLTTPPGGCCSRPSNQFTIN